MAPIGEASTQRRQVARGGACILGCTPAKKSGPKADSLSSSEIVGNCWAGSPESQHPASAQQKVQEFSACQPNCEKRVGSSAGKVHRRWVERLAKDFASAERQGAQALPTWHRVKKQLAATANILKIRAGEPGAALGAAAAPCWKAAASDWAALPTGQRQGTRHPRPARRASALFRERGRSQQPPHRPRQPRASNPSGNLPVLLDNRDARADQGEPPVRQASLRGATRRRRCWGGRSQQVQLTRVDRVEKFLRCAMEEPQPQSRSQQWHWWHYGTDLSKRWGSTTKCAFGIACPEGVLLILHLVGMSKDKRKPLVLSGPA